ncbi:MAG: prepilin-type N-terminal cleavage/methylation domain-containing protein [Acidobacteriota bacterium]
MYSKRTPPAGQPDGSRGFSLVEVLVSLLVLFILMLALMASAVLTMSSNVRDTVRDYGTTATQDVLNGLLSRRFDDPVLNPGTYTTSVQRRVGIKGGTSGASVYTYTTVYTITQPDPNFKCVQAVTTWIFNGQTNRNVATLVIKS